MTPAELIRQAFDAMLVGINARFAKADSRIAGLETKLKDAEKKGFGIRYAGVYKSGKSYEQGQFATYQGGLWHANEDTDEKPGGGPHWTLAVKSGDRS